MKKTLLGLLLFIVTVALIYAPFGVFHLIFGDEFGEMHKFWQLMVAGFLVLCGTFVVRVLLEIVYRYFEYLKIKKRLEARRRS